LRVVVVTRSTPDTAAKVEALADGTVALPDEAPILNPWDEYAVTEAIRLKEMYSIQTAILAVGPEAHNQALKQGLATGIDTAMRVWQPGLEAQSSLSLARIIAAAIQKMADVRLVLFGREFIDTVTDAHIAMTARLLNWPVLTGVSKIRVIDFAGSALKVERQQESVLQTVATRLPAVISVVKEINEPRYPSFINIRKASKAEIPVWALADIGLTADGVAGSGSTVTISGYHNLPARAAQVEMIIGATDAEKAHHLIARLSEEKVL
jgi:electron transfer flavoprotein beta subunit